MYFCLVNWVKTIGISVIAAFLFVGSIGIGIFSKECEKEGVIISYFVPEENECCERKAKSQDCGDCCSKEKEESKGDCRDTSIELVKLKLDFLNDVQVKAILSESYELQAVWVLETEFPSEEISIASGSDPPPIPRQDFLIGIQQWLI